MDKGGKCDHCCSDPCLCCECLTQLRALPHLPINGQVSQGYPLVQMLSGNQPAALLSGLGTYPASPKPTQFQCLVIPTVLVALVDVKVLSPSKGT